MAAARGAHKPSLSPPRRGCPGSLGVSRKPGWRAMGAHPLRALPLLRLLQQLLLIMKTPGMRACWGPEGQLSPEGVAGSEQARRERSAEDIEAAPGRESTAGTPSAVPAAASWVGSPVSPRCLLLGPAPCTGTQLACPGRRLHCVHPAPFLGKLRPGGGKDLPKPSSPSPGKLVPAGRRARQPPFLQSLRDPSSELASRRYPGSWSCGGRSGPHSPPEGSSGDLGGLECGAARVWQAAAAAAR